MEVSRNIKKKESNQINSKREFDNLKSNYILHKLFNNLQVKKSIEILKYNNIIKKRLNIANNNYKEYCENYSSIEIEIIPVKGKYGKFINIKNEDKLYYHIYFNNHKEEIKRNFFD